MKDQYIHDALNRNGHWISHADAKAGVILVAIPAMLALFGPTLMTEARLSMDVVIEWSGFWHPVFRLIHAIGVLLVGFTGLMTLWYAYWAINPNVNRPKDTRGLLFFGDVDRLTLEDYQAAYDGATDEQLTRDYLEQIHTTAKIASDKFRNVKWAFGYAIGFLAISILAYIPTFY